MRPPSTPEPDRQALVGPFRWMRVIDVADLPWAHDPWKCAHARRFQAIRACHEDSLLGEARAGAQFFHSLDANDFKACPYHQDDWATIAAASVKLLHNLPANGQLHDVVRAAEELLPEDEARLRLISLFSQPIAWYPSSGSVTNGQHRTCAIKASGAPRCVARIYGG